MRLHPHQLHALEVLEVAHRRTGSRVLIQQPCGTGKTEIGVRAVVRWISRAGVFRAVVAVPTIEIVGQWIRRLRQLTRLPVASALPRVRIEPQARVVVTTYAALWQRLETLPRDALLVFDEAHHGNYEAGSNLRLIEPYPHVLGLSATPWTEGCAALFGKTAHVALPLSFAVRQGLVCPYDVLPWEPPRGPWGLVYVAGNAAAAALAASLGPRVGWVGVHEPRSRDRIAAWRRCELQVLVADRMLSEGFDAPGCAGVWLRRDTESDVLLVQCAGRALRQQPSKRAQLHYQEEETGERLRRALERCDSPRLTLV